VVEALLPANARPRARWREMVGAAIT
jgi:hypothetical protein